MKTASNKRATALCVANLPLLNAALIEADIFCARYSLSLDKLSADAVGITVDGCNSDEANMAYALRHYLAKRRSVFMAAPSAASLIDEAARMEGDMTVTVSFKITPTTFRLLLAGAAESGAPLEELVGTAVNRMAMAQPHFTIPKLRNS